MKNTSKSLLFFIHILIFIVDIYILYAVYNQKIDSFSVFLFNSFYYTPPICSLFGSGWMGIVFSAAILFICATLNVFYFRSFQSKLYFIYNVSYAAYCLFSYIFTKYLIMDLLIDSIFKGLGWKLIGARVFIVFFIVIFYSAWTFVYFKSVKSGSKPNQAIDNG